MSHSYESYNRYQAVTAAEAQADERMTFIRRTYGHLAGAVLCFIILEFLLFMVLAPTAEAAAGIVAPLMGGVWWIVFLGGFVVLGWVARSWAHSTSSRGWQYAGLAFYVILEAAIFFPLLCIAVYYTAGQSTPHKGYELIYSAGLMTLLVFGGLTAGVFLTRKDFSFLGPILGVAGFLALGLIVCAVLFGLPLGVWFSLAMVALASAAILYTTSNILHHYRTDQYVAASLELFASVAMLFWYILRIFMARE